jgi:putative membrane protein
MNALRGAAAGFAATVPMTIVMEGLRTLLPAEQVRPSPPREIVDRAAETVEEHVAIELAEVERTLVATLAHFAFGAVAGALYGTVAGSRRASVWTGIAYGVGVWAVAYGVGLPSLGLHPAATNDGRDRNEVLFASHVVWGATLGALTGIRRR